MAPVAFGGEYRAFNRASISPLASARASRVPHPPIHPCSAGESYAGIYIPTLAQAIIKYNAGNPAVPIPLKAIAVGNGCIGEAAGVCGGALGSERFHFNEINGHGLVSPPLADAAVAACGADFTRTGAACNSALSAISNEVGRINTYGACARVCVARWRADAGVCSCARNVPHSFTQRRWL